MNKDQVQSKTEEINPDLEKRAIDKLEEMWDRKLAMGDDEFFDVASREPGRNKDQQEEQRPRRRARGI